MTNESGLFTPYSAIQHTLHIGIIGYSTSSIESLPCSNPIYPDARCIYKCDCDKGHWPSDNDDDDDDEGDDRVLLSRP